MKVFILNNRLPDQGLAWRGSAEWTMKVRQGGDLGHRQP